MQANIKRHLVVSAACGVQTLARIADSAGELALDKGMHVLGGHINFECAAF